nr:2-amino-4-hydroxy-6-hydroxymethyldihydropteridine diphosphokinase [Ramlibacter aurantiacus]
MGANLGDAQAAVRHALAALDQDLPETHRVAASALYRSAPIDAQGPPFVNAVAALSTRLPAPVLLAELQRLERLAGRERPYHHAPRTLDLDLLLYGDGRIDSPALTLPHPRMVDRAFVLLPLAEIAPQRVDRARLAELAHQSIERIGS